MSHSAGGLVAVLLALGCQSDSKKPSDPIAAKDVDGVVHDEPIKGAFGPPPGDVVARPPAEVVAPPVDVEKPPTNAKKTDKGVFYKVLIHGNGKDHPHATSQIKVRYTGWTTAGKMFDNSAARGEAVIVPLSRVIPGWTDGLQVMVVGDKTRFWIPQELAYAGRPGPPQGMLVFDVELLEILANDLEAPAPPARGSGLARFPGGRMPSAHRFPPGVSVPPPMTTPPDTVAPAR